MPNKWPLSFLAAEIYDLDHRPSLDSSVTFIATNGTQKKLFCPLFDHSHHVRKRVLRKLFIYGLVDILLDLT